MLSMNKNQMKRSYKINNNISITRMQGEYTYIFDDGNSKVSVELAEDENYVLHDYIQELLCKDKTQETRRKEKKARVKAKKQSEEFSKLVGMFGGRK